MKLNIIEILEALFIPKPNDFLRRNQPGNDNHGLILIPVPQRNEMQKRIDQAKMK